MWRTQGDPILIDLGNDFFIVKLTGREEFLKVFSEGPWMIVDNLLHLQRWKPNFVTKTTKICTLPVWVKFPQLPVEYYTVDWLNKAGDNIGRTINVDSTTLTASRGNSSMYVLRSNSTNRCKPTTGCEGRHGDCSMRACKNCALLAANISTRKLNVR